MARSETPLSRAGAGGPAALRRPGARGPHVVTVGPGTFYWCGCGSSPELPFCDRHHGDDGPFLAVESASRSTVTLCGCQRTRRAPECDGTHRECWINVRTR